MNNKIKQMLDKINNVVNHEEASYNALVETKAEDYKKLLDYITNLQQQNEQLVQLLERASKIIPTYYGETLSQIKNLLDKNRA